LVAGCREFAPVALRHWVGGRQRQALEIQKVFAALNAEI
jgi:hypothetical protein